MNDRQENKVSMYSKVTTFLTEKSADLAAYPVIATIKTKIENNIAAIVVAEAIAGGDNTGYAQVKAQAQKALLAKTLKVGSATSMYYTVTVPNSAVREKVDYNKSELEKMRDSEQYVASKRVHDVADPVKALLGDFGVPAADVDSLATARQTFYAVIQMPKEKFAEAVGAGKTVDRLLQETDVILSEELDTQMQVVSVDDSDLYAIYQTARLIDDTPGGGGSETILGTVQNTVAMGSVLNLGAIPAGTAKIRMTALLNGTLEFGLSVDGMVTNGNTLALNAPSSSTYNLSDFASAGNIMLVRNQNPTQSGEFKIEYLG